MPILRNSKHEKFCQLVAKGETAKAAYESAGYSEVGSRANSSRLITKDSICIRIEEIQARRKKKFTSSFNGSKQAETWA